MIQISIQDKNVLYFTLLAVIKFCPQQGHCCFHGNQSTLKPRRMTVWKKYKEGKEVCYSCFSSTNGGNRIMESRGWKGIYEVTKSNAHLQKNHNEIILEISKCPLFKDSRNTFHNLLWKVFNYYFLSAIILWLIQAIPACLQQVHWSSQNPGETADNVDELFSFLRAETLPCSPSYSPGLLCSALASFNPANHSIQVPRTQKKKRNKISSFPFL
jgi:hypothetical protein